MLRSDLYGIVRIVVPLPSRPASVNAYFVHLDEGGWMLVDGGIDSDDAWAALAEGARVIGGWSRLVLNVVTHMHMDHIGLAGRVRASSSAPLAMGELDAERAIGAAADPEAEREYRSAMLRRNGAPETVVAAVGAWPVAPEASRVPEPEIRLAGPAAPLPFASEWSHVPSPGHTAGHISLFRGRDRVLIAGDAVIPRITPTIGINPQRIDPVGDYLGSLDTLDALEPQTILGGHGDPLSDAERISELRQDVLAESGRIRELLTENPQTPWGVAQLRYRGRDLPLLPSIQALRETRAHLDHLVMSGEAVVVENEVGAAFAR